MASFLDEPLPQTDDIDVEVGLLCQVVLVLQGLGQPVLEGGGDVAIFFRVRIFKFRFPRLADDAELAVDLVLVVLPVQGGIFTGFLLSLDLPLKHYNIFLKSKLFFCKALVIMDP